MGECCSGLDIDGGFRWGVHGIFRSADEAKQKVAVGEHLGVFMQFGFC